MPDAPLAELPQWAVELLRSAPVGHLGMLDGDDRPRVLPVTFALAGGDVWSAVDHKPKRRPATRLARVRHLRRRPEAALCVDRYHEDWSRLAWVQLLGAVQLVDDPPDVTLAALGEKYPHYRERTPSGPFLRLRTERALCWRAA